MTMGLSEHKRFSIIGNRLAFGRQGEWDVDERGKIPFLDSRC